MTIAAEPFHIRVGPGVDVAPCGFRGPFKFFARTIRFVTCEVCREKRMDPKKSAAQLVKMRAVSKAMKASGLSVFALKDLC